jgi:hypothetical protein
VVQDLLKGCGHDESQLECNTFKIGTHKSKRAEPEDEKYQFFENALCAVSIPPTTPESPTMSLMITNLQITNVVMKLVELPHELHQSDFYHLVASIFQV